MALSLLFLSCTQSAPLVRSTPTDASVAPVAFRDGVRPATADERLRFEDTTAQIACEWLAVRAAGRDAEGFPAVADEDRLRAHLEVVKRSGFSPDEWRALQAVLGRDPVVARSIAERTRRLCPDVLGPSGLPDDGAGAPAGYPRAPG